MFASTTEARVGKISTKSPGQELAHKLTEIEDAYAARQKTPNAQRQIKNPQSAARYPQYKRHWLYWPRWGWQNDAD